MFGLIKRIRKNREDRKKMEEVMTRINEAADEAIVEIEEQNKKMLEEVNKEIEINFRNSYQKMIKELYEKHGLEY